MQIGVLVLAAGGSTRLGKPKQLLRYAGQTLLRRAAETACQVDGGPVLIVLGAGAETLRQELAGLNVQPVVNGDWNAGPGTSVRRGIVALESMADAASIGGVLLTLCDQPLVTAADLRAMVSRFHTLANPGAIVAAAYHHTVGVPVFFARRYFDALRTLPDSAGAKPLLRRHAELVTPFPLSAAEVDIDTHEQYERLMNP